MDRRIKHLLLAVLLCISLGGISLAQRDTTAASGFLIQLSYAGQLPGGNLAQIFGFNSNFQGGVIYKTQTNWQYGVSFSYLFGNQLRDVGVFDSIATSNGNVIANDGNYPGITYLETGFDIQLIIQKLIPLSRNLNSGILVSLSTGYIQHHISITAPSDWTPQITGDYIQGYDHLTAGACLTEFIGYQYISKKMYLAIFGGFEFTEAMAKSLRYDFQTQEKDPNYKYEMLSGLRVGWILPILQEHTLKFYTH